MTFKSIFQFGSPRKICASHRADLFLLCELIIFGVEKYANENHGREFSGGLAPTQTNTREINSNNRKLNDFKMSEHTRNPSPSDCFSPANGSMCRRDEFHFYANAMQILH